MKERISKLSKKVEEIKTDINGGIISEFLEWFYKKINIHFNKKTPNLIPSIGSIYEVELGTNIGSELNKKRPCVIISKGNFNKGNTVVIVPLRSVKESTRFGTLSFEIDIENTGLEKRSYITIVNIKEISKKRIFNKIGNISKKDHIKLKKALINFFDIKNL